MKHLGLVIAFLLLLIGCDPVHIPQTIFSDDVCSAPCWNGITPGITSQNEALLLLSDMEEVSQISISVNTYEPEYLDTFNIIISFGLINPPNNNSTGRLFIINNTVEMISFTHDLNFTLAEAIELFGEPESVSIIPYRGYIIGFLNREKGIFFEYNTWDHQTTIEETIEPQINLESVVFFDTNLYDTFIEIGSFSQREVSPEEYVELLTPWNGYGDIWVLYMNREPE
jgi:hypothetical protein